MLREDPAYAAQGGAHRRARQGRDRAARRARPAAAGARGRPRRRVSLGLLDAARPEDHGAAEGSAARDWLHGQGHPRRPHLLRLRRHLQPAPARARRAAARTQARPHRARARRTSSRPATSAAWCSSRAAPCRSCIRWSCSIGRPAGLPRGHWRQSHGAMSTIGSGATQPDISGSSARRPWEVIPKRDLRVGTPRLAATAGDPRRASRSAGLTPASRGS